MRVMVYTDGGKFIAVDNSEMLAIDYQLPSVYPDNFFALFWLDDVDQHYYDVVDIDGNRKSIQLTNEQQTFETHIKPFVDLYNLEKQRLSTLENDFELCKQRAIGELKQLFEQSKNNSYIITENGYKINSNSTAIENINGLLLTIDDDQIIDFCDFDNKIIKLTKLQLQAIQKQVIENNQYLYQQKWVYRDHIQSCTDKAQIENVVKTIQFQYKDYRS